MSKKLDGKAVLLFGATGGIGNVWAREFYRAGAKLILVARDSDKLKRLAWDLGSERVEIVAADATKPEQVIDAFLHAQSSYGRVDAAIIAVGTHRASGINDTAERALEMSDLLYKSIYQPTRIVGQVAQHFFQKQGGESPWLINVSSHAATKFNLPDNHDYSPMKAAARAYMLNLANSLKEEKANIRLTDIQPAIVNTPDTVDWIRSKNVDPEDVTQPEEMSDWIIEKFDDPEVPPEKVFDKGHVL